MHRTKERDHQLFGPLQFFCTESKSHIRTALMKLKFPIMKGQESAKKVARGLEVDFNENEGIVTSAIRRRRKLTPAVWTQNLTMQMAAILSHEFTGILLLNGSHNFLVMSTRRMFDRERRTFPSPGFYSWDFPSRSQMDAFSLLGGTFYCIALSSTGKRPFGIVLNKSQLLNLREIEICRWQNTPLTTTSPRKFKRCNTRSRRRQRRNIQKSCSVQL
jgi:hypothetical protein